MIVFFLGSHPEVSLAELRLVFGVKEVIRWLGIALFDLEGETVSKNFFKLGGTPRYGSVVGEFPKSTENVENALQSLLVKQLKNVQRKEYVLSLYGVRVDKRRFHKNLKDELSGVKYDGKFEEPQHTPAASAHVLLRGGHEFSAISHNETIYVVKTERVQDAKFWSIVDAERPARDMKIGMLPSKLARMMVNFTKTDDSGKIWDPFVGQGTIAMQSAMLGIPVYGTDKSLVSIENAKQNMLWLVKKGLVAQTTHKLFVEPIERAKLEKSITAIATEPFLGKPRFKPFANEFLAKREWREVSRLYGVLLQTASRFLRKGQRLIFVKPTFAFLAENGVRWYNPPLSTSTDAWKIPELVKDIGALLWVQRDNVVGREIVILEKN
ncbi:hypothetical protein IT418_01530 [bacterium]|nr:hypothetical protein [bacterium]